MVKHRVIDAQHRVLHRGSRMDCLRYQTFHQGVWKQPCWVLIDR